MGEPDRVAEEFILPNALEFFEDRCGGNVQLADWFLFWRARYYCIALLAGMAVSYFWPVFGAAWIILLCLLDYCIKRSKAKKHFQNQLVKLRRLLARDGYAWDKDRRGVEIKDDPGQPISRISPVNIVKRLYLEKLIPSQFQNNAFILDAGCKDGMSIYPVLQNCLVSVGIDLNQHDCVNYKKTFKRPCAQGDIQALPLKKEIFDGVLFMEVIEHLFDPLKGLKEITRILKPGGTIILSTDNRNHLDLMDLLNPIIIFERLIGLFYCKVLLPRNIFWEYGDLVKFYHTSFSRTELISLLKTSGLAVKFCRSYFFLPGLHRVVGKIWPQTTAGFYARLTLSIETILSKLPIIKWLGGHWLIAVEKR